MFVFEEVSLRPTNKQIWVTLRIGKPDSLLVIQSCLLWNAAFSLHKLGEVKLLSF